MSKKINADNQEILRIFKSKLLQTIRVKQARDYFDSKRKVMGLKSEDEYPFLRITYSCIDFTHSMLFARFFDDNPNSFSVKNIVKVLDLKKKLNLKSYLLKNKDAIKMLSVWRGNVFAHDNFNVALSSYSYADDYIFTSHFLDFYFKDLMDMLINIYIDCECLYNKGKTRDQLLKELSLEIDQRRAQYDKSIENNFI